MNLHLEFEDSTHGDLIEIDAENGTKTVTLTLNCDELAEDTDYDGVFVDLTMDEARRLMLHLGVAVAYSEVEL